MSEPDLNESNFNEDLENKIREGKLFLIDVTPWEFNRSPCPESMDCKNYSDDIGGVECAAFNEECPHDGQCHIRFAQKHSDKYKHHALLVSLNAPKDWADGLEDFVKKLEEGEQ